MTKIIILDWDETLLFYITQSGKKFVVNTQIKIDDPNKFINLIGRSLLLERRIEESEYYMAEINIDQPPTCKSVALSNQVLIIGRYNERMLGHELEVKGKLLCEDSIQH